MKPLFYLLLFLAGGRAVIPADAAPTHPHAALQSAAGQEVSRYVAALYGETAGENYACKLATAQALRRRLASGWGLRGVYGTRSALLRQPIAPRAWRDCVRAWTESGAAADLTGRARFWSSRQDLGKPYLRGLTCTARVGGHWFFRRTPRATGPTLQP